MPKILHKRTSTKAMRQTLRDWKWTHNHEMSRDLISYDAIHIFRSWLESELLKHNLAPVLKNREDSERSNYTAHLADFYSLIGEIFAAFEPTTSVDNGPEMIALWSNAETRAIGIAKRVKGKPGKMIKKMFPDIPDNILEKIVDSYRKKFSTADLKIKCGSSADDFRHAYSHDRAEMQNPCTTSARKSLAMSCMRHDFDALPNHPAEAYASGDFHIYWVEDESGKIAGRSVVCVAKGRTPVDVPRFGPIYGVSEPAIDLIESAMRKLGALSADDNAWDNARLDSIEYRGGYVAPYIDIVPRRLTDCGRYLRISCNGEIDASDYSGLLNASDCQRYECGEYNDEDDCYSDDDGNFYCDCCYSELFTFCEKCQNTVSLNDTRTVYRMGRNERVFGTCWCNNCADDNAVRCDNTDEWWVIDDTYSTADGETISVIEYRENYFTSDWSDEIYQRDDSAELDTGETVACCEVESDDAWQLMPNGTWSKVQGEMKLEMESEE